MAVYDRDYLTTLPLLYEKANEYSEGDWNKYNNDVGDALLKMIASTSHTVDYYFRRFLTSLVLPNDDWDQKSLIWELTGYKPNYLRADYLMVQLYWPDCGLDTYVPLYQYTPFKITADGEEYVFLCAEDYMIPPLTTRVNVRLVNGTLETIDQDYTLIKNNKVKLTDEQDLDYDLVSVIVSGTKWKQVRNVFYSPDTERIFSVHKESDGTYIYLHKTWQSYVDSYDTSFKIYFVKSNYDFSMYTDDCMTVEFQTELLTLDGEDVSQFYRIIPLLNSDEALGATNLMPSTTEGNRAITVLDFSANASLFPGIASCKAFDWNTPGVCKNPFEVVIVACDSKGRLSDHMKQVLKAYLESICSPLLIVNVIEPKFAKQDILVVVDIGGYKGTLAEIEIKKQIERALKEFYEIGNLPPGRVVKTMELNSLLLHTDSRIYFASVSFFNTIPRSPILIPVLGTVIVITSAETFMRYDFGTGYDKGYVGLRRFEFGVDKDKDKDVTVFISYKIDAHFLLPVDKLPMQLFDKSMLIESKPEIGVGSPDFAVADFGVGDEYYHIVPDGDDPAGVKRVFVFESDGNSVLTKSDFMLDDSSAFIHIKFETGQEYDYESDGLGLENEDLYEIRASVARTINGIPYLTDEYGRPFSLTAEDIVIDASEQGPAVLGNAAERALMADSGPDFVSDGETAEPDESASIRKAYGPLERRISVADVDVSEECASVYPFVARMVRDSDSSSASESSGVSIMGDIVPKRAEDSVRSRSSGLVYIPYNGIILKDCNLAQEKSDVHKVNFVMKETAYSEIDTVFGLEYSGAGTVSIPPDPDVSGNMEIISHVNFTYSCAMTELIPVRPEIYDEAVHSGDVRYVRDKSGSQLHWYFISTSPVHEVESPVEIGYGIYVGFNIDSDSAVYVETDAGTSRGFIYSSELSADAFFIQDAMEI